MNKMKDCFKGIVIVCLCAIITFSLCLVGGNVKSVFADETNYCYFNTAFSDDDGIDGKTFCDFTKSSANNYTAFEEQVVNLTIVAKTSVTGLHLEADSEVLFVDNSALLENGVAEDDCYVYSKQIKCNSVGKFNITVIGKVGAKIYFDRLTLNVTQAVESLKIVPNDNFITTNQDVEFAFVYNNIPQLYYGGEITVKFRNKTETIEVSSADYSTFSAVKSLNANELVLDTSKLSADWYNFELTAVVNGESAICDVNIQEYTKPKNVVLYAPSATYNLKDGTANLYFYIDKGAKPSLELIDYSESVGLTKVEKIKSDREDFDKIALTLDLIKLIDNTNILLIVDGENGDIYRSFGVSIIREITSVEISTNKTIFKNKEKVVFKASVNGRDDYASKVNWFVKDVEVSDTSSEYNLISNGGTFNVYAVVDGVKSESLTVIVKYSGTKQLVWYIILGVSIIGIIIMVLTRKKRAEFDIYKSLSENISDLSAEVKLLEQKFTRKKCMKLLRSLTIVKERCWQDYLENGEQLYKIASTNLDKATKIIKKITFSKNKKENIQNSLNKAIEHLDTASDALLEYKRICANNG